MRNIDTEIQLIENLPSYPWPVGYFENVISHVKNKGLWLEFGVCSGNTINIISSKTKRKKVIKK